MGVLSILSLFQLREKEDNRSMVNIFEKIAPKDEYKNKVGSTQDHLPFREIRDNVIILKDGSIVAVIQTSAVNFDLLSEVEQLAIISSFAGLLNSLTFSIQIVIRSKRLDISQYVNSIKELEKNQSNELLKKMTESYRVFVENLIHDNEVLDKQFYVVVMVSYLELGIISNIDKNFKKALSILGPRVDHIIKQLARIGLKANQMESEKLIHLFYDIYNQTFQAEDIRTFVDNKILSDSQNQPSSPPSQPHPTEEKNTPIKDPPAEQSNDVQTEQPNASPSLMMNIQAPTQFTDIALSPLGVSSQNALSPMIHPVHDTPDVLEPQRQSISYPENTEHRPGIAFTLKKARDDLQGGVG